MSRQHTFEDQAAAKAGDDVHRRIINKACTTHGKAVQAMKERQFRDWQDMRCRTAAVKDYVLANLPELLTTLEQRMSDRGIHVHWAADAEEAREIVGRIASEHEARRVVKAKSMTTEEISLNPYLEEHGIEVVESDLGELIVQLRGEKPYHIVTPCMHMTKEDIGKLFHEKLGAKETASAEKLTMVAREHLREVYVTADIGISGANFLVAEEGAMVMIENEGNGRLSMSCPDVHIAIAGIEKVIPRLADLSLFVPALTTSGTGQQLTCYTSIVRGPRQQGEVDGPKEMHVILLDNGRTDLFEREDFRHALRCIRCGACLNICPVYQTIGGHAYGTTYQGPIGSVITPHLRGFEEFQHLSNASSLCGACSGVCPVAIDLHHLLLSNRALADDDHVNDVSWRFLLRVWANLVASPVLQGTLRKIYAVGEPLFMLPVPDSIKSKLPSVSKKTFAQVWRNDGRP